MYSGEEGEVEVVIETVDEMGEQFEVVDAFEVEREGDLKVVRLLGRVDSGET